MGVSVVVLSTSQRLFRPALAGAFVAALAVGPTPAFPAPLDAAAQVHRQLEPTGMHGKFIPAILPAGADPNQIVTVIVELNDAPLGVTGGSAADLSKKQEAVKNAIAGQGGTVTSQYQHALNGFAVRITRGKAANLARLSGVHAVKATRTYEPDNAQSVPFIGAPNVWDTQGLHGEGVKIAIIDTGLDYTHANFGGPGTPAAYTTAHATETAPADPTLFGPNSKTKVKGGTDLVGDAYDADNDIPARQIPHPDPNPLDCNGHGSHVGGTAAGFGVTDAGATFTGPYDATTPSKSFRIGPGVAPKANLYGVRVFGCDGSASSEVVIAAIDWAVQNKMDIANMSLGSPFGRGSDADAEIDATDNASLAGVLMVISAGNEGASPYIVGRPSTATRALSVAAVDSKPNFPGAILNLSTGNTVNAIDANGAPLPGGAIPIIVLRDGANVSLGCKEAEYTAAVAGKAVVTRRGECARVDRAVFAQKHGAAAAIMVNSDTGFPPFEGPIAGVTIPFLGVPGLLSNPTSPGSLVVAADGGTTTMAATNFTNPGFKALASFTSGGPRFHDSFLKPEVSAPGVSILSTAVGTGNGAEGLSGTSMAAPHVTGLSALVQQSHPSWWSVEDLKQAIVNTSSPGDVAGYQVRRAGAGLVSAPNSTRTVAVAFGRSDKSSLSYGFDWDFHDMRETAMLLVRNHGATDITFNLSTEFAQGRPHSISFERTSITVPAFGHASTNVTLNVPISSVGSAQEALFHDVGGIVKLTPAGNGNSGIALRVPYYLVPRALSNNTETLQGQLTASSPTANVRVTNNGGAIAGTADFYAWGLVDDGTLSRDGNPWELRSAGVQSFNDRGDQVVVFAINTRGRISNFAPYEFEVVLQNEDGKFFQVFSADYGFITTGTPNGQTAAFIVDLAANDLFVDFFAIAPFNGNTILLPVLAETLGLTEASPRFIYAAAGIDAFSNAIDILPGEASFNAFNNTISTGAFETVPVGGTRNVPVTLNAAEAQLTPAKGIMIVSLDNNFEHGAQVELIPVPMPAPAAAPAAAAARSARSATVARDQSPSAVLAQHLTTAGKKFKLESER
ncbi:MAG TPA: S8 family serine peptidase [Chloroflexota bacterium]